MFSLLEDLFAYEYPFHYIAKQKDIKKTLNDINTSLYDDMDYSELFLKLKKDNNDFLSKRAIKRKLKKDLDIKDVIIKENIILFLCNTSYNDILDTIGIESHFCNNIDSQVYMIDVNNFNYKSPLNEVLLNLIHNIGVKYINGEFLTEQFKTDNNLSQEIAQHFENSDINIKKCSCQFDGHDIALIFDIDYKEKITKNDLCLELGIEPSLFIEVLSKHKKFKTIALICSCPRVVFEEFFDKQNYNKARGANKWLV